MPIRYRLNILLATACIALWAPVSRAGAADATHSRGQAPNPPHYRQMPCPHGVEPESIAVSWHFQIGTRHPTGGHRLIHSRQVVHRFYRYICSVSLTWYSHPVITSCPAGYGDDIYHIAFLRRRRPLMRIEDQVEGCTFFWVEGKAGLGRAWGAPLPPGVPNPPLR